ncbi:MULTISPECIES: hypothetical protein [Shewanella]|uniref:hypothetical protein n=1 Tax=Shewanella TaxID=22 RepID=UPI00046A3941|nr:MULTISPECIES: hypothetical protein [Shewanella]MCE9786134.1 hypothetical protein [Shewanella chilikensis]NKZ40339.1 hypothetical protein [Shewanella algae]QTE76409.1 hypothetical protein E1N14_012520 [Shewanella algae]
MKKVIFTVALAASSFPVTANEIYRAPSSGDSGSYFIITSEKGSDGIITVLSSRIGKGNAYTDFTKLNVNCESKQYFELAGSSEDGAKKSPSKPLKDWSNSKWTSLVPGSSKSDLVRYVCTKHK